MADRVRNKPMSDIDEILAGLVNYVVESIHLEPTPVEYRKLNQKQAKQAIQDLILDIIGEDETYEGHLMNWSIEHRNHLRQAQRAKLKEQTND